MWIYIFFFADTNNPNRLPDRAWAKQAETICKGYADQIKVLPDATTFADIKPKAEAMRQRAVVGQQVTDLLTSMVAALRADAAGRRRHAPTPSTGGWPTTTPTSVTAIATSSDWAAGEDPSFAETAVDGKPISLGMDDFADANDMASCDVPGDLGSSRASFREPERRSRRSRHHRPLTKEQ